MKINPNFHQFNCKEGDKIDARQSEAVLEYAPDIIFFEMPQSGKGPDTVFNTYPCDKKPLSKVREIIKKLRISAKKYPYAKSDILVWENIVKMWKQNKNTQIYFVDAPNEFRGSYDDYEYPQSRKDWLFWVYMFIRDSYMSNNIKKVLDNYDLKEKPTVLIFLQSIHWKNVQFLLKRPTQDQKWKYYFKNFKEFKKGPLFDKEIKKRNPMIYKYWKKVS